MVRHNCSTPRKNTTCSVRVPPRTPYLAFLLAVRYSAQMIVAPTIDPEKCARDLQLELWDRQCSLWPGELVTPLDVCDPWVAAHYLDFTVKEGQLSSPTMRAGRELGGFINRIGGVIAVSEQLSPRSKRFTLAHEVGHVVMHPGIHHHREIAMDGMTEPYEPADPKERQANHFAGCFLVPAKQLRRAFNAAFGVESLKLTDDVAFELLGANFTSLMNSAYDSPAFSRVVARAPRFRGRHFQPLHDLFQVSVTTMAIRLRQTGLVRSVG